MRRVLIPGLVSLLCGCSSLYPAKDNATLNKISDELQQASAAKEKEKEKAGTAVPQSVSSSLLPPLRVGVPKTSARQLEQRFDLVVIDAPISQVLMAIVSDTRYSILLSPKTITPGPLVSLSAQPAGAAAAVAASGLSRLAETMTVNLKDVTVFEALDAVREIYGYEYTVDGTRIYVQPPELKTKLYQVNYILGQRRGVSDLQVIGGASSGSASGSGYSSIQASALSTISKSDVWSEVEDSLRTVMGCQIASSSVSAQGGAAGAPAAPAAPAAPVAPGGASSNRANVSYVGDTQMGERLRGVGGCTDGRALTVNQMSGTILVRGLPKELRTIESLLRSMQLNIERQVIIEAKIIDVELNSGAQQGINWAGFQQGLHRMSVGGSTTLIDGTGGALAGTVNAGTSLGGLLGTQMIGTAAANAISSGLGVALQFTNFSALINFLESQGRVHVLSSPRIATLNNQKAVLKVGSEEPFVTSITGGTSVTSPTGTIITPPTLNYQPFFSGISLDVTPQIDENDNITLHVRSMVNTITEKEKVGLLTSATRVPFAVNSISETDSVVKARDGQVIVIGGLMTESSADDRSMVPGLGEVPAVGALFSKGGQKKIKRELVILIKTTVVKSDSNVWTDDISAVQGRIERINTPTQDQGSGK